jgi:hypothetical protein
MRCTKLRVPPVCSVSQCVLQQDVQCAIFDRPNLPLPLLHARMLDAARLNFGTLVGQQPSL